jgi:hypothetical protein
MCIIHLVDKENYTADENLYFLIKKYNQIKKLKMQKSEIQIKQSVEGLVNYLKLEKYEITDCDFGYYVYEMEHELDFPYLMLIDKNNKVIIVSQEEWPSNVLYFLFTLVKVSNYTVSFNWCDDRLERLSYEVESNLEYFKNLYFD